MQYARKTNNSSHPPGNTIGTICTNASIIHYKMIEVPTEKCKLSVRKALNKDRLLLDSGGNRKSIYKEHNLKAEF